MGTEDGDSLNEAHQRATYTRDSNGRLAIVKSRGWEPERIANAVAVDAVNEAITAARTQVRAGPVSVLAYHMARCHMNVRLLAAHTGFWSFQIRRHLRPAVFAQLPATALERYARAFGIGRAELSRLPD